MMEQTLLLHGLVSASTFFSRAGPTYYRTDHSSTIDPMFVPAGLIAITRDVWADTRLLRKLQLIAAASKNDHCPIRVDFWADLCHDSRRPTAKQIDRDTLMKALCRGGTDLEVSLSMAERLTSEVDPGTWEQAFSLPRND